MSKHAGIIIAIAALLFGITLSAQTVYVTKTGEKYHTKTCQYLTHSRLEMPLKKALGLGYTACSKYESSSGKASTVSLKNGFSKETKRGATVAMRCAGKTKSGTRCKRETKSSNRRCYQHS